MPFEQKYTTELPNELGYCVKSPDELSKKVNNIFDSIESRNQNKIDDPLPEVIKQKIYFDKNELAALKIIKVWESLVNDSFPQTPLVGKNFICF